MFVSTRASCLSQVSVCWSCTEKMTIKIERAFSVILWASPATRRSFQLLPQLPTVAAASNNCCNLQQCCNLWKLSRIRFPVVVSKCQTGKLFPSHWRLSPVTAWYNYIIIAAFKGLKQSLGLKQPLLVSGAAPVRCFQNCFKFKLLYHGVANDCYLFDKRSL